eukprot:9265662-Pyramimonas_sp.AAC.2
MPCTYSKYKGLLTALYELAPHYRATPHGIPLCNGQHVVSNDQGLRFAPLGCALQGASKVPQTQELLEEIAVLTQNLAAAQKTLDEQVHSRTPALLCRTVPHCAVPHCTVDPSTPASRVCAP